MCAAETPIGDLTQPRAAKLGGANGTARAPEQQTPTRAPPASFADVFRRWKTEGPLVHEPTGFASLDAATGGGPAYGSRWYLLGAPDACKTLMQVHLADEWLRRGIVVGILAIDEEDEDLTTRFVQRSTPIDTNRARFTRRDCEERIPSTVDEMDQTLSGLPLHMYGAEWTIEAAAEDLSLKAKALAKEGEPPRRMALFVDSIQQVRCNALCIERDRERSPREVVNENVRALRLVATKYRLLAMATSEMNRAAYANVDAAESRNDMTAAKESGSVEFSARVMVSFRWVEECEGELVSLRLVKNKHGAAYPRQEEIVLRLDRERQTLGESKAPPKADAGAKRNDSVTKDAARVDEALADHPGITVRDLYAEMAARPCALTRPRVDAALARVRGALERLPGKQGRAHLHLDGAKLGPELVREVASAERPGVVTSRWPKADEASQ